MANSWFQFQQFRIEQGRSAMKVCTDSCIFGAYVSGKQLKVSANVLDVGAGTGLLSLMWAQQNPQSKITAIEPDEGSFLDLQLNIENGAWKSRIVAIQENLAAHSNKHIQGYDYVICNPPFFFNHLQSPDLKRNRAMHIEFGDWSEWLINLKTLTRPDGQIWMLIGIDTYAKSLPVFKEAGLCPFESLQLEQNAKPFRMIVGLSTNKSPIATIVKCEIRGIENTLSNWVQSLMADFYLK